MNPLAAHLLSVMKNEATCASRAYLDHEAALEEMGYWTLQRPIWCSRDAMPPCRISEECRLVEEFPSYQPPVGVCDGFGIMVGVYVDPFAEGGP